MSDQKFKKNDIVKYIFNGSKGKIVDHRIIGGTNEYLVKFKKYIPDWVGEPYLEKCECDCNNDDDNDGCGTCNVYIGKDSTDYEFRIKDGIVRHFF